MNKNKEDLRGVTTTRGWEGINTRCPDRRSASLGVATATFHPKCLSWGLHRGGGTECPGEGLDIHLGEAGDDESRVAPAFKATVSQGICVETQVRM